MAEPTNTRSKRPIAFWCICIYWAVTVAAMLVFLHDVPGYNLNAGPENWLSLGAFIVWGVWGLAYLATRGETLVASVSRPR